MARRRQTTATPTIKPIEQYEHRDKTRVNNPPIGLVTAQTDPADGKKAYTYDPHLDPQLAWAGKAEGMSFEVPTLSLHVHERIDPRTIIEAVRKQNGEPVMVQGSLFETREENPPLRQAIEFYKHAHGWSNRLIAGDSLLVMNSLLEKEGLAGQVQMVYIDPPYNVSYRSNFQPFTNKRDVSEGDRAEDLPGEPETIRAFRDTWELGIHSYLTHLRDRLLLARELLHPRGSIFVQMSDDNLHYVRGLMDEVFGRKSFVVTILIKKKGSQKSSLIDPVNDYVLWYSKVARSDQGYETIKYHRIFQKREITADTLEEYKFVELADGQTYPVSEMPDPSGVVRDYRLTPRQLLRDYPNARLFRSNPLTSGGVRKNQSLPFFFQGKTYSPGAGNCWKTTVTTDDGSVPGMERLAAAGRLLAGAKQLRFKSYLDDFGYMPLSNWWDGLGGASNPIYVVQTNAEIVERCMLMTTDPGDLVFDPTCGSGTTATMAEQWGRRWITCDTSRVAITLAKQRLMTSLFKYYELAHPEEGVSGGFRYKTVPHVMLQSIANDEPPAPEILYDQPYPDSTRARVTGPFTVEAVPAPIVMPISEAAASPFASTNGQDADTSIARSGPTLRHAEWRDELLKTGIRGKGGQVIHFARVEPLPGTRWLHADAETRPSPTDEDGQTPSVGAERAAISFGPEAAPLEQTQVERALEEAWRLVPRPRLLVFAAFQFDPEAAKDIDETNVPGITLLKAQMNADLLTADLKKKRASNESFWLVGQPDVDMFRAPDGRYQVEVHGFDYYNTRTGQVESGDRTRVAMWLLDPDYDGRSLFPRQVFFPMAGDNDGWARLAKNLKAEIDEDRIEAYRGTVSLPFERGEHRRVAVKIVDDRGIESLKIVPLD